MRQDNMKNSRVLDAITHYARQTPAQPALVGVNGTLQYRELAQAIDLVTPMLKGAGRVLGLALDNDPVWAVFDLAALKVDLPLVPLPAFFSAEQTGHAIRDAGVDSIFTDQPERMEAVFTREDITVIAESVHMLHGKRITRFWLDSGKPRSLPKGTAKVTYTSGTTGTPKGVCLGRHAMEQVADSLLQATMARATDRHLCLLPLTTLLENIAGLYVPLLAGATSVVLPTAEVGLSGAVGLDLEKMLTALRKQEATTTVLTPELLHALVIALEAGLPRPQHLRFIAVGGASAAPALLQRAERLGLPVYEGYGLSECASVVAVNTHGHFRPGTVGKPLPHVELKFGADGEILVRGACLLGYADGQAAQLQHGFWPTGDLGHLDADGYLHVTGRKKNIFITSFGRNVAPEWVERELTLAPSILQAAVFGEARPWNVAVIVRASQATDADVDAAIAEANESLPDYARIGQWLQANAPFTPHNGQLTANGRLRRAAIWQDYQNEINALYEEPQHAVL